MYRRKRTRWLAPRRPATFVSVTRFVSKWLGTPIVVRVTGLGCRIRVHLVSAWSAATDRAWKSRLIKIAIESLDESLRLQRDEAVIKMARVQGLNTRRLPRFSSSRRSAWRRSSRKDWRPTGNWPELLQRVEAAANSRRVTRPTRQPAALSQIAEPLEVNPSSAGLGKTADLAGAAAGLTLKTAKLICAVPPWQGTKF